jgi:hypothetical protein
MMRAGRHVRRPPDLTSLFDVLFIVVFAVLIRGAAVQQEAEAQAKPKPAPVAPPEPPPDLAALRERALAAVASSVAERQPLVARISSDDGKLVGLEIADKKFALDVALLEHSPDPDVAVAYLGDRSADQRLCRVATLHLTVPDLAAFLVIVAPDKPLADLPHALHDGLRRDAERCFADHKGIAVVIGPETK